MYGSWDDCLLPRHTLPLNNKAINYMAHGSPVAHVPMHHRRCKIQDGKTTQIVKIINMAYSNPHRKFSCVHLPTDLLTSNPKSDTRLFLFRSWNEDDWPDSTIGIPADGM